MLKQSGRGDFPWCVKRDVSFADGYVEVEGAGVHEGLTVLESQ